MGNIPLNTPLSEIKGIGPRFLKLLKQMNISTVRDLLWHFPTRYEDWSEIVKIIDLNPDDLKTIQGTVEKIEIKTTWQKRMLITEALISDNSGSIKAIWFNQPYIKNILKEGVTANFSGKVALYKNELHLSNPTYEIISAKNYQAENTKHTGRLVPVYPETRGLTSKGIRYLIQPALENLEAVPEFIPGEILEENDFPGINEALNKIHFPSKISEAEKARKRFAFEELFLLQINNILEKIALAKESAPSIEFDAEKIKNILDRLPFELTISQKKSLWEILRDISKDHPMSRLLQGDVGSGKTIVVAIAALVAAKQGFQAAIMAPTEILARQHYKTFRKFFGDFQNGIGLLISKETRGFYGDELEAKLGKPTLLKEIENNKIKIIIGTHALLQKKVSFKNLGLVIIDEQHRFGVKQRASLVKNNNLPKMIPHFLSMSATPIPRTLMMTVFGDLNLSMINEMPKGRKAIITKIVAPENREKAYAFIRGQIRKGRQAFVICPRIEDSEIKNTDFVWDVKAVKVEYEKLAKKVFPDLKVAMLHGKMPSKGGSASGGKSKEEVMRDFVDGKIDILVSTSVVEVGVDVPNATIMMIEGADRFGLAQLYQFRGRVGRGEHQSFCLLFTESKTKSTYHRLQSIVTARNGFELAEKDLAIRGPGEFLGQTQSGLPDIAMRALQNPNLIKSAREAAEKVIKESPTLKKYPDLKNKMNEFKQEIHFE
jgi:ATP-dependent DNA helicase RecG